MRRRLLPHYWDFIGFGDGSLISADDLCAKDGLAWRGVGRPGGAAAVVGASGLVRKVTTWAPWSFARRDKRRTIDRMRIRTGTIVTDGAGRALWNTCVVCPPMSTAGGDAGCRDGGNNALAPKQLAPIPCEINIFRWAFGYRIGGEI